MGILGFFGLVSVIEDLLRLFLPEINIQRNNKNNHFRSMHPLNKKQIDFQYRSRNQWLFIIALNKFYFYRNLSSVQ
jgi:hypothetical protein